MVLSWRRRLKSKHYFSLIYHDLFDYPLSIGDLERWVTTKKFTLKKIPKIEHKNGYLFLKGRENTLLLRKKREKNYQAKLQIAKKASLVMGLIPFVRGVFLTGALAMQNADENSDIDFMVITSRNCLWTTRLLTYLLFYLAGIQFRRFSNTNQKDKICLNIWLDESTLAWDKRQRNVYTAHEIAQVIPLVNRDKIYERFIWKNKWIRNYWPNAVKVMKPKTQNTTPYPLTAIFETLARKLQFLYMRRKKTVEVISESRAIFHPVDRSKQIISLLEKYA